MITWHLFEKNGLHFRKPYPSLVSLLRSIIGIYAAIFVLPTNQQATCTTKIFPKIVGGVADSVHISQIDVYLNNLVFAGESIGQGLCQTTANRKPTIGVIYLDLPGTQFKWSVASDRDEYYSNVCFSADGALVATVTYQLGSITVLDGNSGELKNIMKYTDGINAQNFMTRSLLLSSQQISKAYVVSQMKTTFPCAYNQLFSFDLQNFSKRWAKQTQSVNCEHLGVVFGRDETVVYAYSQDNNRLKATRIDESGASPVMEWTYGFVSLTQSRLIYHTVIDSSQDMLAITGKTFDISTICLLLYKTTSQQTFIATLNLATLSITLQETLPKLPTNNHILAILKNNPFRYLVVSYGLTFYTNLASPATQILHATYDQSVIYSSDVSNAAYQLSSSIPSLGLLIPDTTIFINYGSPYLDKAGFSFTVDNLNQFISLDLNQINRPSWASYQPFVINTVTQATTTLTFQPGIAKTISITPFSATAGCGSEVPVFTYKGLKTGGAQQYVIATDNIGVDSATGAVTVTASLIPSTYTIIVKGTLQNGINTQETFTLIANNIPVFNPQLTDQVMNLQEILQYKLPSIIDTDIGDIPIIDSVTIDNSPSIMTFSSGILSFEPTLPTQLGLHTVSVKVTDAKDSPVYTFTLMINQLHINLFHPPEFRRSIIRMLKISANEEGEYNLPIKTFTEDMKVTHLFPLPEFLKFDFPKYKFSPKKASHLGQVTIKGTLENSDGQLKFEFNVLVQNQPPYLKKAIDDIKIEPGFKSEYKLPIAQDKENNQVKIKLSGANKNALPNFIKFDEINNNIIIEPDINEKAGVYKIIAKLSNSLGQEKSYNFIIQVMAREEFQECKNFSMQIPRIDKQRAFILIKQINRDGIVKLNVMAEKQPQRLIELLLNETIQFTLISQKQYHEIVNHTIIAKDMINNELIIQLRFRDPSLISNTSTQDILELEVIKQLAFCDSKTYIYLQKGTTDQQNIPPQLTDFQLIWMKFDDFSFLMINTMISIPVPGVAQILQQVINNFIYFDLMMMEKWFPQFLNQINGKKDQFDYPINYYFEDNGFESKLFMKNIGSAIIYLLLYILMWLSSITLSLLQMFQEKFRIYHKFLKENLMWKYSLIFLSSQFNPFLISSLVNLYQVILNHQQVQINYSDRVSSISSISSIISLAVLSLSLICIIKILKGVHNQPKIAQSEEFQTKYAILIEDLNLECGGTINRLAVYWNGINLIRWTATICILVFLREVYSIQIILLLSSSIFFQALIIYGKPIQDRVSNRMAFVYELLNSLYLLLLICLTDFSGENDFRHYQGLGLAIVDVVAVLINLVRNIFIPIILWIYAKCQRAKIGHFASQRQIKYYDKKSFTQIPQTAQFDKSQLFKDIPANQIANPTHINVQNLMLLGNPAQQQNQENEKVAKQQIKETFIIEEEIKEAPRSKSYNQYTNSIYQRAIQRPVISQQEFQDLMMTTDLAQHDGKDIRPPFLEMCQIQDEEQPNARQPRSEQEERKQEMRIDTADHQQQIEMKPKKNYQRYLLPVIDENK